MNELLVHHIIGHHTVGAASTRYFRHIGGTSHRDRAEVEARASSNQWKMSGQFRHP